MINLLKRWYRRNFSAPGTVEFAAVLVAVFIVIYYFMWLFGPLIVALCLHARLGRGVGSKTFSFRQKNCRNCSHGLFYQRLRGSDGVHCSAGGKAGYGLL